MATTLVTVTMTGTFTQRTLVTNNLGPKSPSMTLGPEFTGCRDDGAAVNCDAAGHAQTNSRACTSAPMKRLVKVKE
jgi:hypothetical protein